ncbi:MAG: hypothetical protein LUD81_00390, partial [Clostridiales bacterium]|nr:hypothetical protein [Clostridiales bacterium]
DKNPEIYGPDLAASYYNIGILYKKMNEPETAKIYREEAFKTAEKYKNISGLCERICDILKPQM